jgi:Asp-tRNA(Asn)/Glu-tRNA(Gln) amidotransferase A subunit family amidase
MRTDTGAPPECEVIAPSGAPAGLLEAFWRYDSALLANDQATMGELFLPGPHTLRGDGLNLLVGHEAIVGFRSSRSRIPTRQVAQLHVRVLAEDAALLMARTRDGAASGLQTQLWQRIEGRWLVAAAHVSLPTAPSQATAPHPVSAPAAASAPAQARAAATPCDAVPVETVPFDATLWRAVGDPLVAPGARGPLDGVGIAVKDLFAVAGHPTGAGVPAYLAEQRPQAESAPAVSALLAAGAHIVGVARTDEFAYSLAGTNAHYGTPPNPAAPGRISGGSTSGPASAVALGQAAVGLGTDTAGSIRVPASYQALVGMRSTHGAVNADGVLPLAVSFDTVGWLTRDVSTSTAIARVLLPDPGEGVPTARRAVRLPTVEAMARADVQEAFSAALESLAAAGRLPAAEPVDLPKDLLEHWFLAFRTVQAWEAWQAHGRWIAAHPGALGADVAARFAQAAEVEEGRAAEARDVVADARRQLRAWLEGGVLVLPSASGPAPTRDATGEQIEAGRAATLRMTCLAGLAGAPALSMPLLRSAEGLPVGLCLLGAPGTDLSLLTLAAGIGEPAA